MEQSYETLLGNPLFKGIGLGELTALLDCLGAFEKTYGKNQYIVHQGDPIHFVGIVLEGAIKLTKTDYHGNTLLLAEVWEGDLFAEVFACAELSHSPVSITATTESRVLFFDYKRTLTTCNGSCGFHQRLIANMLSVVAQKALYLNRRIDVISQKTLRDKLLTYLSYERAGRKRFTIPLNREELANFLCADRSAVSNELSKLQKEGLLSYEKNTFSLVD